MPAYGAAFVASKIDAIASNPDVWAKTVFILNYDENDGLFDHVPPAVPPGGNSTGICQRTSDRGWVPRSLYPGFPLDRGRLGMQPAVRSHIGTSVPGNFHGRPGTQYYRLAQARVGDLTAAFRFGQPGTKPPSLPDTSGPLTLAKYGAANPQTQLPGADQQPPSQEKGRRHRTP